MSSCPTINFQLSIMSKWLPKHISTKVSYNLLLGKEMFTMTLVDLECETSISVWEFEIMIVIK